MKMKQALSPLRQAFDQMKTKRFIPSASGDMCKQMGLNKIWASAVIIATAASLAGCDYIQQDGDRPETALEFPRAFRPVSDSAGTSFSTEAARDKAGEANLVMDWAGIEAGSTVADIGAGEGYYTIRLAKRVGAKGRVLAQDINAGALQRLGERVSRDRLDNVSIKPGAEDDPRLPDNSFDRVFLVHMYHEVTEPYAFLWRLRPALAKGGEVIVVDRDAPTGKHGIPPQLLFCEFQASGYRLKGFTERMDVGAYFARFEATGKRPDPSAIKICAQNLK